jgi:large subunit ribosomal protein L1
MTQHGKNYRNAKATFDREELYSPVAAVRLLKTFPDAKFDQSVEVHFNLGLNVRHPDAPTWHRAGSARCGLRRRREGP